MPMISAGRPTHVHVVPGSTLRAGQLELSFVTTSGTHPQQAAGLPLHLLKHSLYLLQQYVTAHATALSWALELSCQHWLPA